MMPNKGIIVASVVTGVFTEPSRSLRGQILSKLRQVSRMVYLKLRFPYPNGSPREAGALKYRKDKDRGQTEI
jgi:hypothetical protein